MDQDAGARNGKSGSGAGGWRTDFPLQPTGSDPAVTWPDL